MNDSLFIVSREAELLAQLERWGPVEGAPAIVYESLNEAYGQLEAYRPLLLLVDRRSEKESVLGLLRKIRRNFRDLEIILLESPRSDKVRQGERLAGVDRFIDLPLPERDLKLQLERRTRLLRFRQNCKMIGKSEPLEQILEMILHIAPTDISVLITGESGTGKELISQIIHEQSRRSDKAFLALNCGALPEGTLESELFGHERGAFTGAQSAHAGYFERADNGTIFLDEIGELSQAMQIRLLRVLETGEFIRMGGVKTQKADVRLIAATNRDLDLEVREGRFRRDLLHRIKVIEVKIPSLRERSEDIPLLVEHFIRELHEREGTPFFKIEPALMEVLASAPWYGNVRELRNTVQRIGILATGARLTLADLPDDFVRQAEPSRPNLPIRLDMRPEEAERELLYRSILALREDVRQVLDILLRFETQADDPAAWEGGRRGTVGSVGRDLSREEESGSIDEMERRLISRILDENQGHRRRAAEQLGISERTLYRKLKEFGLG